MAFLPPNICWLSSDGVLYVYDGTATITVTCANEGWLYTEQLGNATRPIFGLLWEIG